MTDTPTVCTCGHPDNGGTIPDDCPMHGDTPTAQPNERDREVATKVREACFHSGPPYPQDIIATYRAEIEAAARADERAKAANIFWDPDDPESPMSTPFDEMGDWGRENGIVHEVWRAVQLPSIFVAQLLPADDADSDDEWMCEADTREEAQALLDAELERRKRVESGEIDNG